VTQFYYRVQRISTDMASETPGFLTDYAETSQGVKRVDIARPETYAPETPPPTDSRYYNDDDGDDHNPARMNGPPTPAKAVGRVDPGRGQPDRMKRYRSGAIFSAASLDVTTACTSNLTKSLQFAIHTSSSL